MLAHAVLEKPLRRYRHLGLPKYVLTILWVGAIAWLATTNGGYDRVEPLYQTPLGVSVDSAQLLVTYYFLLLMVLLSALLRKNGFCRYFCPFWSPQYRRVLL